MDMTTPTDEQTKNELARKAMNMEPAPAATSITVDLNDATRIPLDDMTAFGPAFAPLAESFRTLTQEVTTTEQSVVRITTPSGKNLDLSILQNLKDAKGTIKDAKGNIKDVKSSLVSLRDTARNVAHPELRAVSEQTTTISTTIPYDPTTLLIAAALAETNRRLDAIQETQQAMFSYMQQHDKADLRGDLETLRDVMENYRYNADNEKYKSNKHILVQAIRNNAEKAIVFHQAQLEQKLQAKGGAKGLLKTDKDVRKKVGAVREELDEYRLSVYLYAYSSFVEVMLLQNFNKDYLASTADKIERYANKYRELYTDAYNALDKEASSSVRAFALGGLSTALGHIGKAIEKTPVGVTQIDERIQGAGKGVGKFNDDVKGGMMGSLVDACKSDVRPFVESIERVSELYNKPSMLMVDDDSVYVVTQ